MRILLSLAIALIPMVSAAANKKTPSADQLCELAGSWAAVVMTMRQNGHSLSSQLSSGFAKPGMGGSRELIMKAYEYPRYSTFEMQQRAQEDFQADVELECYKKKG